MAQITHTIYFEFTNNVNLEEIKNLFKEKNLGNIDTTTQNQIVYSYAQIEFEKLVTIYHNTLSEINYELIIIDMKKKKLRVEKQLI